MGFSANLKSSGKFFLLTDGNLFGLSRAFDGIGLMKTNVSRLLTLT